MKWSSDADKITFANQVLNFINPKFEGEEEYNASKFVLLQFAEKCELTAAEFMLALEMAADGRLYDGEQKVRLYREIDRLKLGEIKAAYLNFKRNDRKYEAGREKLKQLMHPEPVITDEQKREVTKRLWEMLKTAVSEDRECSHAFLFYDKLVAKGHFKTFMSDAKAKEILLQRKMQQIIRKEAQNPVIFSKTEAKKMMQMIASGETLPVHNIAVIEVKNDLVYNFVRKRLKASRRE